VARIALVALLAAVAAWLSSCGGSSRSNAAVCKVWDEQGLALHDKFEATDREERTGGSKAMLNAIVNLIGAPGDIAHLMGEMGEVAPAPIEQDFESLATAFKKMSDSEATAVTDPLAALGGNLVESLTVVGPYHRVDAFLAANCGIPGH
jgi:hypothetical protein